MPVDLDDLEAKAREVAAGPPTHGIALHPDVILRLVAVARAAQGMRGISQKNRFGWYCDHGGCVLIKTRIRDACVVLNDALDALEKP